MCSGRGPSIWDTFCHDNGNVRNNENGDVACDSYHLWMEDVKNLQRMGVGYTLAVYIIRPFIFRNCITDLELHSP